MKNANPLNRDEMRKVNGGVPPVCNVGNACVVYVQIQTHMEMTYGSCKIEAQGCVCTTTDSNMVTWYGSTEWCRNVE